MHFHLVLQQEIGLKCAMEVGLCCFMIKNIPVALIILGRAILKEMQNTLDDIRVDNRPSC